MSLHNTSRQGHDDSRISTEEEVVTRFLASVKANPRAYDRVREQIREFLLEEKREVDQAIEGLLELRDMLDDESKLAREIEWIERDLEVARQGIGEFFFNLFLTRTDLKGYFHDRGYHRPEVEVVVDSKVKIVTYMVSVVRVTLTSEQTVKSLR